MKTLAALLILTATGIAGCSTTPMSPDLAIELSRPMLYATPNASSGHVTLWREQAAIMGNACAPDVYLDGQDVIDSLTEGSKVDFYPPAGEHVLSLSSMCKTYPEIIINVQTGKTVLVEFGFRHSSPVMFVVHK